MKPGLVQSESIDSEASGLKSIHPEDAPTQALGHLAGEAKHEFGGSDSDSVFNQTLGADMLSSPMGNESKIHGDLDSDSTSRRLVQVNLPANQANILDALAAKMFRLLLLIGLTLISLPFAKKSIEGEPISVSEILNYFESRLGLFGDSRLIVTKSTEESGVENVENRQDKLYVFDPEAPYLSLPNPLPTPDKVIEFNGRGDWTFKKFKNAGVAVGFGRQPDMEFVETEDDIDFDRQILSEIESRLKQRSASRVKQHLRQSFGGVGPSGQIVENSKSGTGKERVSKLLRSIRADLDKSQGTYPNLRAVLNIRRMGLAGFHSDLMALTKHPKLWVRFNSLVALAESGHKMSRSFIQSAVWDKDFVNNKLGRYLRRFRIKSTPHERYVLRGLLPILPSRERKEALRGIRFGTEKASKLVVLAAASYDSDAAIRRLGKIYASHFSVNKKVWKVLDGEPIRESKIDSGEYQVSEHLLSFID